MLSNILTISSKCFFALLVVILVDFTPISAQNLEIDSLGFETFTIQEGDTTYQMKKYFLVYLKQGPNRDQSTEEAAKIQEGHMNHMNQLAEDGHLCIAGPMGDDGETRGIMILSVPTLEQVQEMVDKDPAVIAGRLIMEIHPWWGAVGSKLH